MTESDEELSPLSSEGDLLSWSSGDEDNDHSNGLDGDVEGADQTEGDGADEDGNDGDALPIGSSAAIGLTNMQPPEAYLEGAQPLHAQATGAGALPILLPSLQSPVLRRGKVVLNIHENRQAKMLHSSPGKSRAALAYDGGRYVGGTMVKLSKLRVCPIGGQQDLRRGLLSGASVGRQAVLVIGGTNTGRVGVVDAGYMGGPKPKVRFVGPDGREDGMLNIEAAKLHAVADADLSTRAFLPPQRDALRPFVVSSTQSQGPSTVQWSMPEKEMGSGGAAGDPLLVGGVPQQAAAASSSKKVYRVPRSQLESFLLWLQVEQRVDYSLQRLTQGGSGKALAYMFSGKPYPPPLP
ncbi:hypothetical protein Agub_g4146, partial [Astrephomene gubernaculifera]